MEMTQQKFKSRFSKLGTYETIGAVICYATVILILFHLNKMNTWYLMTCSVILLAVLSILPIFSLRSIWGMKKIDLLNSSYKDIIEEFSRKKRNMMLIQQFGATLSILIMWLAVPVFTIIADGKDFFKMDHSIPLLIFYILVTAGVVIFSVWGVSRYKRVAASAERDLEKFNQ